MCPTRKKNNAARTGVRRVVAKKRKGKICGHQDTQSGKPCYRRGACPYHTEEKIAERAKDKDAKSSTRQTIAALIAALRREKFIQSRLQGNTVAAAAREAGYSKTTAEGKIYQLMRSPAYRERIEELVKIAGAQAEEITGGIVGESRMDIADLYPDDEFLQRAQQLGISRFIKKLKRRPVVAGFDLEGQPVIAMREEVELYSAHEARKLYTHVFAMKDLPLPSKKAELDFNAAVERIMQSSRDSGVTMPDEKLRKIVVEKLGPAYQALISSASNRRT